jgi:hypothetical protein
VAAEHGLKPIQEIQVGERVWAFDHASESWRLCHVLECYQSMHEGEFVVLDVGGETIESTQGHPFWVIEGPGLGQRRQPEHSPKVPANSKVPGRWVDAGDLSVGDVLLLKHRKTARITALTIRPANERVYNFNVEELHCYAIGAAEALVHNNSAVIDDGQQAAPLQQKPVPNSLLGAGLQGLQEGWNKVSGGWLKAGGEIDDAIANAVMHPVDTALGMAQSNLQSLSDPLGTALGMANSWKQKFSEDPSEALGEIGFNLAFAAATMKAGQALGASKYCFPAGTLVDTSTGRKPIERIEPEERVWGYDLASCTWRACLVLQTFCQNYDGRSVKVGVLNETIEATYLHPFWVVRGENLENRPRRSHIPPLPSGIRTPGRWVDAGDLLVGDDLLLRDGRIVPIETILVLPFKDKVYNLDVDDVHCFAVGFNGILVHNNNGLEFPANPDDLLPGLPRNAKGHIFPNELTRIRPEMHPLKPGETFSPRHHGQHYHVETRPTPNISWNNQAVTKLHPPGYVPGEGTGFLPGEPFPGP